MANLQGSFYGTAQFKSVHIGQVNITDDYVYYRVLEQVLGFCTVSGGVYIPEHVNECFLECGSLIMVAVYKQDCHVIGVKVLRHGLLSPDVILFFSLRLFPADYRTAVFAYG